VLNKNHDAEIYKYLERIFSAPNKQTKNQQINTTQIIGQGRILVPNNYFVRVDFYVYFTLLAD